MRGLFLTFGFVIAAFFPFLALYLDGKGLTESDIGLVIAAMAVARIVLNPLWGHLADATIGRRTSLQIGASSRRSSGSCSRASTVWSPSPWRGSSSRARW